MNINPELSVRLQVDGYSVHVQPPPQALRFLDGRGERETSDW